MPSNVELYEYYCRRSGCHPNSLVARYLRQVGDSVLEVVDVSGNYVGQRGLIPLLDLVKNTKTVHTLNISNHELGLEQVQHLAYCLALHPSMRTAVLRNAGLHDGHIEVLLQLLSMNAGIVEVDVAGNNSISVSCAKLLTEALRRNAKVQQQRRTEEAAHATYLAEKAEAAASISTFSAKRSFTTTLSGRIPAAESGGYVHYATWWKNPQYVVKTSRQSLVSFTLQNSDEVTGATQMGLMVLRHDGVHRAVAIVESSSPSSRTVVAESPVDDRECVTQAYLQADEFYVVMPYTFNPGRALQFRLTATLINDDVAQEEGWVTMEPLDARYDWCVHTVEDGAWTAASAGGSGGHTTWRRNDMYRLSWAQVAGAASTTAVTVYVRLTEEGVAYRSGADDAEEDRAIGIDVVTHDAHHRAAPPLFYTSDVVCASLPHAVTSSALLKVELPAATAAADMDVYVVPSLKQPGQTGTYTLTVFSSVAVQLTRSAFPHGWRYRALAGAWDEACCCGCRAECSSWKNNPAYEVHVDDAAQPLIACVELTGSHHVDAVPADCVTPTLAADKADVGTKEQRRQEAAAAADAEAVCRKAELASFYQRHRSKKLEVGVMAVDVAPPAFATVATSAQHEHAASVVVMMSSPVPRDTVYVVPMLRHAADTAAYTLELFSSSAFVVGAEGAVCLAARERHAQLAAYTAEREQRAARLLDQASGGLQTETGKRAVHDTAELQATRASIFHTIAQSGQMFVDRDFPRGASSLFIDPAAAPPADFPAQTVWKRVSELAQVTASSPQQQQLQRNDEPGEAVREVSPVDMPPPSPEGPRHWFASVLQAVAVKPGWLHRIFVLYAREAGFAQFAYYKQDSWIGVTVDDYLLVDHQNSLVYGHSSSSSTPENFFFALAEKAYAKLHRCYEALERKVNPDQTLLHLLCQGLMDVTGGITTVTRIRSLDKSEEVPSEVRERLWRTLKRSIESSLLCSLMLEGSDSGGGGGSSSSSTAAATRERTYVGLLPDRLYGVVDARFVEQQRLVKIRLFDASHNHIVTSGGGDDDGPAAAGWRGKWSFHSPRWTTTLRDALEYHTAEPHVAWVHFDELLYYFTHFLVTEVCGSSSSNVHITGSFVEEATVDVDVEEGHAADGEALSLRNPQFALTITAPAAAAAADSRTVELHVGLHRRDPRLDITRAKGATAQLKTGLGFAVFATADNTRRLSHLSDDDQLLQLVQPSLERDQYVTLLLTSEFLCAARQLTIMPFREHLRDRDVSYTLSASLSSSDSRGEDGRPPLSLDLTHVAANTSTCVSGRWGSAGDRAGPPGFPQWRNNPQFFLSAAAAVEVTVTIRPVGPATTAMLGFTLHRARHCSSLLNFDASTVVARAAAGVAGGAASCVVRLAGMAERRGMPYVLVPHSSDDAGEFELVVVGNKPAQLRPIDPRLDWHRLRHRVAISADEGNAGGDPSFPSWRFNTQLALTFPVERDGRLFVSAKRVRSADPRVKVGMLLLHAEAPVEGCYRRRLTYSDTTDVVARSVDAAGESVVDVFVSLPRDRGALILVVYADQPYKEAEVEVSFYSGPTIEVQPVAEWSTRLVMEGSWELGTTAAGSRDNFASWINNPFYGLSVLRPTTVTLLLVQYPRDHEHPVVKRCGAHKAFLPPPLAHPDRCTAIQLSVVKYDASLSEVVATTPTTRAEACIMAELSPAQPYFVVPCTQIPQHDGDFKLFAFAEYPIELYVAEKPRLPYV
jgi:hypothetical protein